jgi:DNA-binding HxlR family transcriptional regulator
MATKHQQKSSDPTCQFIKAVIAVGDVWTLLIIRELLDSPKRYQELLTNINGISKSMLSTRLKSLMSNDIIYNTTFKTLPPKSVYTINPAARNISQIIEAYYRFGGELFKSQPEV